MDRDRAISLARQYRDRSICDEREGGESVVVISDGGVDGEVVGLNYSMRYANETRPGTICVDLNDNVFIATGCDDYGDDIEKAHHWVVMN
jgi:hypothetical protein